MFDNTKEVNSKDDIKTIKDSMSRIKDLLKLNSAWLTSSEFRALAYTTPEGLYENLINAQKACKEAIQNLKKMNEIQAIFVNMQKSADYELLSMVNINKSIINDLCNSLKMAPNSRMRGLSEVDNYTKPEKIKETVKVALASCNAWVEKNDSILKAYKEINAEIEKIFKMVPKNYDFFTLVKEHTSLYDQINMNVLIPYLDDSKHPTNRTDGDYFKQSSMWVCCDTFFKLVRNHTPIDDQVNGSILVPYLDDDSEHLRNQIREFYLDKLDRSLKIISDEILKIKKYIGFYSAVAENFKELHFIFTCFNGLESKLLDEKTKPKNLPLPSTPNISGKYLKMICFEWKKWYPDPSITTYSLTQIILLCCSNLKIKTDGIVMKLNELENLLDKLIMLENSYANNTESTAKVEAGEKLKAFF